MLLFDETRQNITDCCSTYYTCIFSLMVSSNGSSLSCKFYLPLLHGSGCFAFCLSSQLHFIQKNTFVGFSKYCKIRNFDT